MILNMSILSDLEKIEVLKQYDLELDKYPKIQELKKVADYGKESIFNMHEGHKESIAIKVDVSNVEGIKEYINNPDFDVKTVIKNPTNMEEIYGEKKSLECSLFITQLLEYNMFVSKRLINPDFFARIRMKLTKRNIAKPSEIINYNYLDKGLSQLAMRIRKIPVGLDNYLTKVEYVSVPTTAYYEILKELKEAYIDQNGNQPNANTLSFLKSRAISLACDMKDEYGQIIKNPVTIKALECGGSKLLSMSGMPLQIRKYQPDLNKIDYSDWYTYEVGWRAFRNEMQNNYGVCWNDNVTFANGKEVNVWEPLVDFYFDNRDQYSLQEQHVLFKKRR